MAVKLIQSIGMKIARWEMDERRHGYKFEDVNVNMAHLKTFEQ